MSARGRSRPLPVPPPHRPRRLPRPGRPDPRPRRPPPSPSPAPTPHALGLIRLGGEPLLESRAFAGLWDRYDVTGRNSTTKTLQHPGVGTITLHPQSMEVGGQVQGPVTGTAGPTGPAVPQGGGADSQ
ncbi:hypothetical protein ACIHEJ_02030 [Streptomyces sp. NPDC052301]|uniref:MmyB family transcriptional regulator n=1 Tax=Streptomyces sp. NPDC052301 TaxID=3365687 RepID=UPI0037CEF6CA